MNDNPVPAPPVVKRVQRVQRHAVEVPITKAELDELLDSVARRQAAARLAQTLEMDTPRATVSPGLLGFLSEAFAASPGLRSAADAGNAANMKAQWTAYAKSRASDARFWHAWVCLMRERMVEHPQGWTAQDWESLSALWIWVMCSGAFWDYFRAGRYRANNQDPRGPLPAPEERDLFEWALDDWLQAHKAEGERALSGDATSDGQTHLRCLKTVHAGEQALRSMLSAAGWEPNLPLDTERASFVMNKAGALLSDWKDALLSKAVTLPPPQAIDLLRNFCTIGGESLPMLCAIMTAHQRWSDAEPGPNGGMSDTVAESAKPTVARLEAIAKPGESTQRENGLLADFYLRRGRTTEDHTQRAEYAESALNWAPDNLDAQTMYLFGRLNCQRTYDDALNVLADCERRGFSSGLLQNARGQVEKAVRR